MKPVILSPHAREQLALRGATEEEVRTAILEGEQLPARAGRSGFRKNFAFGSRWRDNNYETKQVMPIVVEGENALIVVTVYVFYFGG